MKRVGVIVKLAAVALVGYALLVVVMAAGFMGVVAAYRDTRGTVIVPVYIALHLLVRAFVFFGLGFAVGRRSPSDGSVWDGAAAGLLLAVALGAVEMAVGNIFTANSVMPTVSYLTLLPLAMIATAAAGGWVGARRRSSAET